MQHCLKLPMVLMEKDEMHDGLKVACIHRVRLVVHCPASMKVKSMKMAASCMRLDNEEARQHTSQLPCIRRVRVVVHCSEFQA